MQICQVQRPFVAADERPILVVSCAAPAISVNKHVRGVGVAMLHGPGDGLPKPIVRDEEGVLRSEERTDGLHVDAEAANAVLLRRRIGG